MIAVAGVKYCHVCLKDNMSEALLPIGRRAKRYQVSILKTNNDSFINMPSTFLLRQLAMALEFAGASKIECAQVRFSKKGHWCPFYDPHTVKLWNPCTHRRKSCCRYARTSIFSGNKLLSNRHPIAILTTIPEKALVIFYSPRRPPQQQQQQQPLHCLALFVEL